LGELGPSRPSGLTQAEHRERICPQVLVAPPFVAEARGRTDQFRSLYLALPSGHWKRQAGAPRPGRHGFSYWSER